MPLEPMLDQAVLAAERAISVARIVFMVALNLRLALSWGRIGPAPAGFCFTVQTLMILFSIYAFSASRRGAPVGWLPFASVGADALVVFLALLSNVLWVSPDYLGLIRMADCGAILIAVLGAGFRLSVRVALFSGLANGGLFALLMALDWQKIGQSGIHSSMVLFGLYIAAATALAVLLVLQALRLIHKGAQKAIRAEQSRLQIDRLMKDHHDLRTIITAATLNVDILSEKLERSSATESRNTLALTRNLKQDLRSVKASVNRIKERALAELMLFEEAEPVDLAQVIQELIAQLCSFYPEVEVCFTPPPIGSAVLVTGGDAAMRRILFNLLVNAAEGDGEHGARRIDIVAQAPCDVGRVLIYIRDDGPGFPQHVRTATLGHTTASTKPGGSGIGLFMVYELVRACSGEMRLNNRAEGGAQVSLELALAL